jgi:hypothetical protein
MKVVINRCFGGFGLSHEAIMLYGKRTNLNLKAVKHWRNGNTYYIDGIEDSDHHFSDYELARNDQHLVAVVEELGEKANGYAAELSIVEVPDDVKWHIHEYDGIEHIAEDHRTWS